jgi:hypothetical protein
VTNVCSSAGHRADARSAVDQRFARRDLLAFLQPILAEGIKSQRMWPDCFAEADYELPHRMLLNLVFKRSCATLLTGRYA